MSESRDTKVFIEDILDSIQAIYRFIDGLDKTGFFQSEKDQAAVTWKLAVIGEAVTKLPDSVIRAHPEIPWPKIRGMRNLIIHEYHNVNLEVVWKTVTEDLPPFEERLKEILKEIS